MGNEILLTGQVKVNRTNIDSDFLLDVRKGNVPYHVVEELADTLFSELDYSYNHSILPHNVNEEKIDNLLIDIVENYHSSMS